jgi:hypothetical protein
MVTVSVFEAVALTPAPPVTLNVLLTCPGVALADTFTVSVSAG